MTDSAFADRCVSCGAELHPERAKKYNYCMAPQCQGKNLKDLTMVAVGMNKAADEIMILDAQTAQDLASGKYRDQRRGLFGPPAPSQPAAPPPARGRRAAAGASGQQPPPARPGQRRGPASQRRAPARPAWTRSQQKLALLYNEQGLRPGEIAAKLRMSSYLVTQIILAAKNRGKS